MPDTQQAPERSVFPLIFYNSETARIPARIGYASSNETRRKTAGKDTSTRRRRQGIAYSYPRHTVKLHGEIRKGINRDIRPLVFLMEHMREEEWDMEIKLNNLPHSNINSSLLNNISNSLPSNINSNLISSMEIILLLVGLLHHSTTSLLYCRNLILMPRNMFNGASPPTTGYLQESKEKSFIRGQFVSENMPAWEREEKLKKHNIQQDTQNVLLQQIKEKEMVKARMDAQRKQEEEREQNKLLRDQELLKERYEREAEEGKRKAVWRCMINV
jgi:hypothetical protein